MICFLQFLLLLPPPSEDANKCIHALDTSIREKLLQRFHSGADTFWNTVLDCPFYPYCGTCIGN
jgi:hypothetical protein